MVDFKRVQDRQALPSEIVAQHLVSAPVDVVEIVSALGLELAYEPMGDLAGKIERKGPTFKITVNSSDNPRRKRFTIAHEIGHYVLHRDMIGDGVTDDAMYRSSLGSFFETQANQYAAFVLMPPNLVKQAYADGKKSYVDMAKYFDVSEQAAQIRMKTVLQNQG
ncbi:MAG: ImmA/IrrE family metallo-endopeptidase [Proteobacteria bacterium]|nr:ImmA/IrrE family metallo-endopeptidase [Pseudomonadota bacterium]